MEKFLSAITQHARKIWSWWWNKVYKKSRLLAILNISAAFLFIISWTVISFSGVDRESVSFRDFNDHLKIGSIDSITYFELDNTIYGIGTIHSKRSLFKTSIPQHEVDTTKAQLDALQKTKGYPLIEYRRSTSGEPFNLFDYLFGATIPLFFLTSIGLILLSTVGNVGMSSSETELVTKKDIPKTTFADVGGIDEARRELEEIVEFLKNPEKFSKLGGKMPKGVLLIGPPGTGKTLLAKAVAGEAGCPFFSRDGSSFVEMYVGVGAGRVRSLFDEGRKNAPCVIFIDELDAVGKTRGAATNSGGDREYEQTLMQLQVEMDGMHTAKGIIVLAATNRPETLDPALVRPGRFDKQVVVDKPDLRGRVKIAQIHAKNKKFDANIDFEKFARTIPGTVGADIENLINEAALIAGRKDKEVISWEDLMEARDKVYEGLKRNIVMTDEQKRATAFHEAGHAVVAHFSPYADPVEKVTIIPRGMALGVTRFTQPDDQYTISRKKVLAFLVVALGGRVGEKRITNDLSTGAANDLERATNIAQKMVCQWGMSEAIGPIVYTGKQLAFLGNDSSPMHCSETTKAAIDAEIKRIIEDAQHNAESIIEEHREQFNALVAKLLEKESVEEQEIEAILGPRKSPQ